MEDFLAGGFAGAFGLLSVHPVDTVRIRMQNSTSANQTITSHFNRIFKHEGTKGLFKGVASPLLTCTIMNSILFFTYESTLKQLEKTRTPGISSVFLAGSVGGITAGLINSPTELVKIRAQVNQTRISNQLKAEILIFKETLERKIITRGLLVTIIRDSPSYGLYFALYEYWIRYFGNDWYHHIFAGGFAGGISWTAIYPVDVVKTRWQLLDKSCSILNLVKEMYIREGRKVFFKGYVATLWKGIPQNSVIFFVYEKVQRIFTSFHRQEKQKT
eukprot:snap_masked-scaffold_3-processed-gene-4.12-mRNA-1 protein AED:1.00 eAED:1.00 QI:0/-1/0/0/-1/1/1/0/272